MALILAGSTIAAGQNMEVYSKTASIPMKTTRQFSAYVPLSPNTITWSVNDIAGGNTTIGTVSSTGLYTAPQTVPMANVVTLSPSKFAT